MEAEPRRPRSLPGSLPPERQLSDGLNTLERITQHSKGLVDDITSWIELKVKLTQLEIQQKIQRKIAEMAARVAPVVVFALAGLFFLVTLALGIGWWLGHPFWGFLAVTLLLGAVGGVLKRQARRIARELPPEPTVPAPKADEAKTAA